MPNFLKSQYVFCHLSGKHAGRPYRVIDDSWKKALRIEKLPDMRVHDLWHIWASWVEESGILDPFFERIGRLVINNDNWEVCTRILEGLEKDV